MYALQETLNNELERLQKKKIPVPLGVVKQLNGITTSL